MSPKSVTLVAVGVADKLGMVRAGIVANGKENLFAESFGDYAESITELFVGIDETPILSIIVRCQDGTCLVAQRDCL